MQVTTCGACHPFSLSASLSFFFSFIMTAGFHLQFEQKNVHKKYISSFSHMPTSSESLYAHSHTQITISYHPLCPHTLSNPLHIHMRLTRFWPALTPICFISLSPCFKSSRPTPKSRPPPINPHWTKCQWSAPWKCMKGRPHWIPQLNSDREKELHHSPRPTSLMKCTVRRACSAPQRWSRQIK